jgi:hypothetical protein
MTRADNIFIREGKVPSVCHPTRSDSPVAAVRISTWTFRILHGARSIAVANIILATG